MPKFYSRKKTRVKLAYRTPNWFRRAKKFSDKPKSKAKDKQFPANHS